MPEALTFTSSALSAALAAPLAGTTTLTLVAADATSAEVTAEGVVASEAHSAETHAAETHAADAHAVDAHGEEAHAAAGYEGAHHGRHVSHPPEPPHLIQIWFQSQYDQLKSEGKNPYGDPVDDGTLSRGLTVPQILHVGRLDKQVPLIGYAPWENHAYFGLGCLVLVVIVLFFTRGIRRPLREAMRKPTTTQVVAESVVDAFDNFVRGILGDKNGRLYLPWIGSLFFLVLLLNLMGIVPTMRAPTSSIVITFSLALCTLMVVQFTAWVRLGPLTYLHHLAGSPQTPVQWVLSPLFLIIEGMSDFIIKPLSLSLRLMGNILGKDILLGSFLFMGIAMVALIPGGGEKFVGIPISLPFYFLALLLSTIQALIFALLSTIYVLLVLPHDHDHHDEEHAHH